MGIFLEEVMGQPSIKALSEAEQLNLERIELLDERAELVLDIINEALWDDLKIKKEDLLDPNKIKSILDKIEREQTKPKIKERLLNGLYLFLLGLVGFASGMSVAAVGGFVLNSEFVVRLGACLAGTLALALPTLSLDRHDRLMDKINAAIKKLERKIKNEEDPKNKKIFQDQLKVLKQNLNMVAKNKKDRNIRSHDIMYAIPI